MSTPYPPPPAPRRRSGIVWPMLLIGVGVILLLQNLGILSAEVWGSVWRLWPLILIFIGLEWFLGDAGRGIIAFALIVAIALGAAALIFTGRVFPAAIGAPPTASVAHTLTQDLQGATSANVVVRFGAGTFNIGALDGAATQLATMTYQGPEQLAPMPAYQVRGGQGELSYVLHGGRPPFPWPFTRQDGSGSTMDLLLTPTVPISLDVQEGASSGRLDLRDLQVSNLALQTGASHVTILMPRAAGTTTASIRGGAATLDIQVPQGVAAQIQYEGGLSTVNVDQSRFPAVDSHMYRSPDYDSASNTLDLSIHAGVTTITVTGAPGSSGQPAAAG